MLLCENYQSWWETAKDKSENTSIWIKYYRQTFILI